LEIFGDFLGVAGFWWSTKHVIYGSRRSKKHFQLLRGR